MNQSLLLKLFSYDGNNLIWKNSKYKKYNGKIAGTINDRGYRVITLYGKAHKAHRLTWLYHNGYLRPNDKIDHINGNRLDNNINNLRVANNSTNLKNSKLYKNNSSGHVGIRKINNKFVLQVGNNNRNIYCGSYTNIDDALVARKYIYKILGYHINHGNK